MLVTGASSGIGLETARAFAKDGAQLVLAARRIERLESLASELRGQGTSVLAIACDVTVPKQVDALFDRIAREHGGLDVLVNNAGVGLFGPFEKLDDSLWQRVFEVNVFGLARVTRAALPLLRRRKGARIINVSSVLGHRGLPLMSGYGASKAAVNSLTESLRTELAPEGIHVLLVSPGVTETEFRQVRLHPEGFGPEQVPLEAMSAAPVAEAIVEASRKLRRDTVLTLAGKATVYANRYAPALFDRFAQRMVGKPGASK